MQRARVSNHPCHRLSVPSAKRFWCRHCMMVFEDAITRWRHSRTCRSTGGFDNFVRRREIETQTLQKMAETLDPEMVTQVAVPSGNGGPGGSSKELCCFICRQRFVSLDEMREHVKYPCNKPPSMQRSSLPQVFPEPTFGTGIQQHYTEAPTVFQTFSHAQQGSSPSPSSAAPAPSTSTPQAVTVYMNDGEQAHPTLEHDGEAKPTNIYVNEKGETVIEVENLDLNTKSGELSLAHLLTQLSQQGIVFDHQQQAHVQTEVISAHQETPEVDNTPPTAVDAANTLTQLAGSAYRAVNPSPEAYRAVNPASEAYRGVNSSAEAYAYPPPAKQIKTESVELHYHVETQGHADQLHDQVHADTVHAEQVHTEQVQHAEQVHAEQVQHVDQVHADQVQGYLQKEEEEEVFGEGTHDKYIICTSESEVISVMRANHAEQSDDDPHSAVYHNGQATSSDGHPALVDGEEGVEGHTVVYAQPHPVSQAVSVHAADNGQPGGSMVVLQDGQPQVLTTAEGQLIKTEDVHTEDHLVITTHHTAVVEQPEEMTGVVTSSETDYHPGEEEGKMVEESMVGVEEEEVGHHPGDEQHCVVVPGTEHQGVGTTVPHVESLVAEGGEQSVVTTVPHVEGLMAEGGEQGVVTTVPHVEGLLAEGGEQSINTTVPHVEGLMADGVQGVGTTVPHVEGLVAEGGEQSVNTTVTHVEGLVAEVREQDVTKDSVVPAVEGEVESTLFQPQVVSVSSSSSPQPQEVVLQQSHITE